MICVAPGIEVAWLKGPGLDRRPRAPWVERNIHAEPVAPVAIGGGYGHPLAIHETWLHRKLRPVTLQDRCGCCRVGGPALCGAVLRLSQKLAPRNTRQVHPRSRVGAVPVSALTRQVLFEGVAEQIGVGCITRNGVSVDRRHAGVRCGAKTHAGHRVRVVRSKPGLSWVPAETIRRRGVELVFDHLHPEHLQATIVDLSAHRPEPRRRRRPAAVLERLWVARRTSVQQSEAASFLHHSSIVHEARLAERRSRARLVDENVLEQPQISIAAERIDMLVVPAENRPDPAREESVETPRTEVPGATDVGGNKPAG